MLFILQLQYANRCQSFMFVESNKGKTNTSNLRATDSHADASGFIWFCHEKKQFLGQFEASWVTWYINLGKIWRDISCYDNFGRDNFKTWISTEGRELTADDYETLLQLDSAGPSVSSDDQAVEAGATLIWFVSLESGDKLQKQAAGLQDGSFLQL